MSEKYKEAIDRLKGIAEFNKDLADRILEGEQLFPVGDAYFHFNDKDKAESMARTYYFWSNSCFIAAWLLENEPD